MKTVLIDPGHGGKFSGATGVLDGMEYYEKDLNLDAALFLARLLMSRGINAPLTRTQDLEFADTVAEDLQMRCNVEHQIEPDCFISLHCNAAESPMAHGIEIFTSIGETQADRLATICLAEISRDRQSVGLLRTDTSDGDMDKEAPFKVLKSTRSPAILVEMGFISHQGELEAMVKEFFIERQMVALAEGIRRFLELLT